MLEMLIEIFLKVVKDVCKNIYLSIVYSIKLK